MVAVICKHKCIHDDDSNSNEISETYYINKYRCMVVSDLYTFFERKWSIPIGRF